MKRWVYIGIIVIGIIIMVLFSSRIFSQLNQHHVDMEISKDELTVLRLKEHVEERFFKTQSDTIFLASFLGEHLDNYDADAGKGIDEIRTELDNVVPSLFKVNSILTGMSFLDQTGVECITMNADGIASEPFMKADIRSDCIKKTSVRNEGEIYTTFDSNSIYICTSSYDKNDAFSGVIVVAVSKDELLKDIKSLIEMGNIILMEDTGKYILTSSKHNGGRNFLDEYPESLFSDIVDSQSGNIIYEKNTLLTYEPVDLDDRQWFLLLSTDKDSVTAMFSSLYEELIVVLILTVLAMIIAIIFWSGLRKKDQLAKQEKLQNQQLENVNKQLQEKQYALEEQNTIIEELNSQLEDENERYLQQKEILQAIIDSLGAGVIMTDASGKIIFINKAWKSLFEYLDFHQNCHTCESFYINDETCGNIEVFMQNMMKGMENGQEIATELLGLTGDGESSYMVDLEQTSPLNRFLHLYSNPCIGQENHEFGRVFVARDISHQKEVDRLKLELINTVSHELRTPMSSILGFSELLLTRKLSEERNKEYVGIIYSEAKRLTDLINDFLDIQRMESGKQTFNKQFYSINQILEESVKLFENAGGKHNILYDKNKENPPEIYCDRDKIQQVLSNLLSNALKYSPDGGEIEVNQALENGRIKISVKDHGLGIPDNVKDKLFTKFFRVDNDDRRKIGGTGLGLAICKEIIRAHGGDIGVESTYGYGSTFFFYLPCSDCNTNVELKEMIESDSSINNKANLLIVEDDASMVSLIKEILKDERLEVHSISSGEDSIKLVAKYHYKLIILDIALSGQMNGWDVLKELKSNQTTADTPIIISSVNENKSMVSQNDISDYLIKPFESEQLIKMVQKAFNGKLNSKMMVNSNDSLTEDVLGMLKSKGIGVRKIEHSGNILIITLKGQEDL